MEPLPPSEAETVDMLSSLPEHVLDEILMRLDLRDAVRTSTLSCAWRRRWECLPGLALCFPRGTRPSVISRVLLRYTRPTISRFAANVLDDDDVDDWLIALSRRSVESISIFNHWRGRRLTLHSSIFSCHRLVSLNLKNCSIPPHPRSRLAGFPLLQELHLNCVVFAERELQAIIQGSPLLRQLVLEELFSRPVDSIIEAPNLQTLVIESEVDNGWRFGKLPRLQYANIDVVVYPPNEYGEQRLLQFFTGVSQVQELIFCYPHDEVEIETIPFTFHNLKSLAIETHFLEVHPILLLFSLLRSSPNLEKLKIEIQYWDPKCITNSDILSEEWTDAHWTDGMFGNLQVVQIKSYIQWLPLSFMKLILSKASLLRTLSVDVCPVSQDDPLNELQMCSRASAQAQVLFKEDLDSDTDGAQRLSSA